MRPKNNVSVNLDSKTANAFDVLIQTGLVASGAVSEADNDNVTLSSRTATVELDTRTASQISRLINEGLVASGAVSDADNNNVTISPKHD